MKSHGKGFVKGTLFGALLGGIAALLLAPKSGRETQADLKKQARRVVKTTGDKIEQMEAELTGRIDDLKDVARDLKGEAYEDSQRLITKAEILKSDLQESADRLAGSTRSTKDETVGDIKRLLGEGAAVISELERTTKKVVASAKDKVTDSDRGRGRQED